MHTLYVLARSSVTITVTYPCCKEIRNETLLAKRLALRLGRRIGRMAATHTSWIMDAKKSAAKAAPSEDVDKLSGPELVLVVWLERTQRPRNLGIHLSYSYSFPPGRQGENVYRYSRPVGAALQSVQAAIGHARVHTGPHTTDTS